jgi:hypothetical protein
MPYTIDDEVPNHLKDAQDVTTALIDALMKASLCDGVIIFQFLRTKRGFQCINSCRGVLPPNVKEFVSKAVAKMLEGEDLTSLDRPN